MAHISTQLTVPQPSMLHAAMTPTSFAVPISEAPVDGLSNVAQATPSQIPNRDTDIEGVPTSFDHTHIDHQLPLPSAHVPPLQPHALQNSSLSLNSGQLQSGSTVALRSQPNQNGTHGTAKILFTHSQFHTTVIHTNEVENGRKNGKALQTVYDHSAPAAFHNSLQRCDPPKCHPGTRQAIQRQILDFSDDPSKFSAAMMWLYGPAGAGKSAIAQTVAETLFENQKLAASFFFSQMSKDGHRHHEQRLITTIAYQIIQNAPLVEPHIQHEIQRNPAIFDMSLKNQITSLILQPFRKLGSEQPAEVVDQIPRTIIIDGLDECSDSAAQERVLNALQLLVGDREAHPFNVIVISRPEIDIMQWFDNKADSSLEWRLNLQDSTEKDNDIAIFVTDELTAIAKSYRFKHHLPPGWPSESIINEIVGKSSGQFIYAATVVRYVQKCQGVPSTQLQGLLSSTLPKTAHPFAELDALYTAIIKKSPYRDEFVSLVGVVAKMRRFTSLYGPQTVADLIRARILMEELIYVQQCLSFSAPFDVIMADFGSLFNYYVHEKDDINPCYCVIRWFHKSLFDFIQDPTRAPEGYHLDFDSGTQDIRDPHYAQQVTQWSSADPSFILFFLDKISEFLCDHVCPVLWSGNDIGLLHAALVVLFQRMLSISIQRLNIPSELYIISSLITTHSAWNDMEHIVFPQPDDKDPGWLTLFSMASEYGLQDTNAYKCDPFNPFEPSTKSLWRFVVQLLDYMGTLDSIDQTVFPAKAYTAVAFHYVKKCLYMYEQGATFHEKVLFLEKLLDQCAMSAELVVQLKKLLPYLKGNGDSVKCHHYATQRYIERFDKLYGPRARIDLRAFPKHPFYDDISEYPSFFIERQLGMEKNGKIVIERHAPESDSDTDEWDSDVESSPKPSSEMELTLHQRHRSARPIALQQR
ncbi:hypothetical protein CVT24_007421 [Panaeolus cyanescens]|uniref:Nephrocystin 3-like N-terminal domain-containing protein n=1 Tax=Panaeolus cyanescens TaxID=181874 RepID=A0A409YKY8_9AGAR|nr:hypothetical protein CVT24_007421 [Panaeolus cyanescens]